MSRASCIHSFIHSFIRSTHRQRARALDERRARRAKRRARAVLHHLAARATPRRRRRAHRRRRGVASNLGAAVESVKITRRMGKQCDGRDASFEPFPTVDVARAARRRGAGVHRHTYRLYANIETI